MKDLKVLIAIALFLIAFVIGLAYANKKLRHKSTFLPPSVEKLEPQKKPQKNSSVPPPRLKPSI